MSSIRDRIAASDDRRRVTVDVPEWDVKIELRSPTVRERGALFDAHYSADGTIADPSRLAVDAVIACAYDPDTGEKVFTDDDVDFLYERSSVVLDRLAAAVTPLVSPTETDVDVGKGDS